MLVGRYCWELSGRNLHRKIKSHKTPSEADLSRYAVGRAVGRAVEGSAVSRTFRGNVSRPSVAAASIRVMVHDEG
jgi:hypothetical protein